MGASFFAASPEVVIHKGEESVCQETTFDKMDQPLHTSISETNDNNGNITSKQIKKVTVFYSIVVQVQALLISPL